MGYQDESTSDSFNDDYVDSIDDELDPEGPSVEDLRRLRHGGAKCPSCNADIYDDTDICPACGDYITPESGKGNRKIWNVVAAVVLVVIVVVWAL